MLFVIINDKANENLNIMLPATAKKEMLESLRREILAVEGLQRKSCEQVLDLGLDTLEAAFPDRTFPLGNVHEFISSDIEDVAATTGFITALLSRLIQQKGLCAWISPIMRVFPPGLDLFGMPADKIIFINPGNEKDLLWVTEEALKCSALAAVVVDIRELTLTASRRLQLAVEQSRVTGLLHRHQPKKIENTASVARWQIHSLSSNTNDIPGVGNPRWRVALWKVRNGKPGDWIVEWTEGGFKVVKPADIAENTPFYKNAI